MSTYRVKPVPVPVTYPPTVCHVLTCEQCDEPLGNASTPADLTGMPPEVILALWPEMNGRLKQHEHHCRGHNHQG